MGVVQEVLPGVGDWAGDDCRGTAGSPAVEAGFEAGVVDDVARHFDGGLKRLVCCRIGCSVFLSCSEVFELMMEELSRVLGGLYSSNLAV
jgi:hypothetical protein